MKRKIALILTTVMMLVLLAGCGNAPKAMIQASMAYDGEKDYYMMADMVEESAYAAGSAMTRSSKMSTNSAATALPENRKWIITMSINAETYDLTTSLDGLFAQIKAAGGYVESQQINNNSQYSRYRSASITARIPAEVVDTFVTEVSGITNVTSTSRYVRDVTLSYADTEGRVEALKTEEKRLLELMEQAEKMSDLLDIESRLTEVRYQLESHASQLRLYDNQIDYATVDIYINEVQQYTPTEKQGFWERITDGLSDSIVDLGETIVDFTIGFIVNLPYLICLALLAWAATVLVRRSLRKRKAKKAAKEAEKA